MAARAFARCPYRILVGEKCSLARRGLRGLLGSDLGLKICGEVSNGRDIQCSARIEKDHM
jgi:hypothetical protein